MIRIPRFARLAAAGLGAALLVGFHLSLLWERIGAATLFEPLAALRWVATLLLAAALVASRRLGFNLWQGRGAVVFWLMVLLLHAGTVAPLAQDLASEVDLLAHASVIFVLPVLVSLLSLSLLGLGWPPRAVASQHPRPRPTPAPRPDRAASFDQEGGFCRLIASLPPPAPAA